MTPEQLALISTIFGRGGNKKLRLWASQRGLFFQIGDYGSKLGSACLLSFAHPPTRSADSIDDDPMLLGELTHSNSHKLGKFIAEVSCFALDRHSKVDDNIEEGKHAVQRMKFQVIMTTLSGDAVVVRCLAAGM